MSDLNRSLIEAANRLGQNGQHVLPLSAAQLGIWFAQKLNIQPRIQHRRIHRDLRAVDPILFERALRQVITEADALRLKIIDQEDGPRQIVRTPAAWSMPVIDVSAEPDARAAAEAWMRDDLAQPIDPTDGPLFCFALFKTSQSLFLVRALPPYHHGCVRHVSDRAPFGIRLYLPQHRPQRA